MESCHLLLISHHTFKNELSYYTRNQCLYMELKRVKITEVCTYMIIISFLLLYINDEIVILLLYQSEIVIMITTHYRYCNYYYDYRHQQHNG